MAALWAGRSIRPAQLGHSVDADLLIREVPDSLLECFWLVHAQRIAFPVWLVKYIIAQTSVLKP